MVALFVIAALAIQQRNSPPGTFDDPNTKFRSAGIRGTIDPGGYAASATVKTQTEFYRQLTALQTAALRPAWRSCSNSDARRPAIRLLAHGDFAGSAALLETLLRTHNDPALHELLGLAYEGTGQLEAAAEQFRVASAERPDEAAVFAQGAALLLAGDVTRAESVFRAAAVHSTGPASLTNLGQGAALFEGGRGRDALSLFLDAGVARPDAAAPFLFLAIAIRSADSSALTRCIEVLRSLAEKTPASGYAHYALGCALAANGAPPDQVISQLEQAVRVAPRIADAHFRLAEIYATKESLAAAAAEYRTALDCDPQLIEAHYRLGQLYARSGQQLLAKQQLELHQQLRAQQKSEIESGKVPIRLDDEGKNSLSGLCQGQ